MFELYMQLGTNILCLSHQQPLTTCLASVNVCVGDMDVEKGNKLASELQG